MRLSLLITSQIILSLLLSFNLYGEEYGDEEIFEVIGGEVKSSHIDEKLAKEGLWGQVQFGVGGVYLSRDSFRFGEYSGIEGNEVFGHAEMDLNYFRKSFFFDVYAESLGLDSRNVSMETGKLDDYKFFAEFDQIPHQISSQNKTPFDGAGTSNLTLKPGFVQNSTFTASPITNSEDVKLKVNDRKTSTIGFAKILGQNEVNFQYRRIKKDGLDSLGGVVGNSSANPRSIILPATIDTTTNEFSVSFANQTETTQWELEYFLSLFENQEKSITFETPYNGTVPFFDGTPFGFGPLPDNGRISREPDNQLHRISFSGGRNLTSSTRVSAIAEYSLSLQDENLLPFGIGFSSGLLPRKSAEAKLETYHLNLKINSRPLPRLSLNGKYRHYQTENSTPKTLFLAVVNDTGGQVAVSSDRALSNLPYEYTQDKVGLDASYRLARATYMKLGYELERYFREFRAVDETFENKFNLNLRSHYYAPALVSLNLLYSDKTGDSYNPADVTNSRHTSQFLASPSASSPQNPLDLRRFDIADRERMQLGLNLTLFPSNTTTVGLGYKIQRDDYGDGALGLREVINQDATLDLNYAPNHSENYSAFFAYGNRSRDQRSRSHNPFAPGSISDPNRNYDVALNDNSFTAGAKMHRAFLDNKYTLDMEYSFSGSMSDISFSAGSNPAVANPENLPELNSFTHTLSTTGKYKISKVLSVGLTYSYENYSMDDFFTDGLDPLSTLSDSNSEVILLERTTQDYEAHTALLFVTYSIRKLLK